jgi:hypothetical protein
MKVLDFSGFDYAEGPLTSTFLELSHALLSPQYPLPIASIL